MKVLRYTTSDGLAEVIIHTPSIVNAWRRFSSRITDEEPREYCTYEATRQGELWLTDFDSFAAEPASCGEGRKWENRPPVFYETCEYNVSIIFHKELKGTPKVVHQLKEVTDKFSVLRLENKETLLSGSLDFLNEPGNFSLSFACQPIGAEPRTDTLTFPVVSPKLDTKNDYLHIMQDINREYNELVYQYLTKTFQNLQRKGTTDNDIIWLSIFHNVIDDYLKSITYIVNRPHLRVRSYAAFDKAERIKRWTPRMCERYKEMEREERADAVYFRHEEAEDTLNTRENRFVKYSITSIAQKLTGILNKIAYKQNDLLSEEERELLQSYKDRLQKLEHNALFRRVGRFEGFRQESIVLQKRTGYAQVYRDWLILRSGIDLLQGSNAIGVRPVWELYEVWCFLKMREMIADILGIDLSNASDDAHHEEKGTMLNPFSESKVEHKVEYYHHGDHITLCYQHTYNRRSGEMHTATTEQRPDIVLNIEKPDGFVLTYLYDAKYRVLDDTKDAEREEDSDICDYPPADAINQMHRYRDAIYYGSDRYTHTAKEIIGGYILFPGRGDAKVRQRYYYQSIQSVNIGAFPLLPDHNNPQGEGSLLRQHLQDILLHETAYEQIKDSVPQKGLHYTQKEVTQKNVYVGYVKSTNPQIDEYKANKATLYYTGYEDFDELDIQSLEYLLPIVSGSVQGVYPIESVGFKKLSKIRPLTDGERDELRVFFTLGDFVPFIDTAVSAQKRIHNHDVISFEEARAFVEKVDRL